MAVFRGTSTPIFIITRDKLEQLMLLLGWLEESGYSRIIIVDNDSSYPPLLDYLEHSDHTIVRHDENLGPHAAVWGSGVLENHAVNGHYVVTYSDVLPDPACPPDALDYFHYLLERYPDYAKVGFALRIDDLPDCYALKEVAIGWERQFWWWKLEPDVYHAAIDTTFALYRPNSGFTLRPAIRTGRPYLAKHLPWYSNSKNPTAEEVYYRVHANQEIAHWDLKGELPEPPSAPLRMRLSWPLHARLKVRRNTATLWTDSGSEGDERAL